jgi:pimeloyl-ACP methyl ester carboxylesterase
MTYALRLQTFPLVPLLCVMLIGCATPDRVRAPGRYENGLVLVLPGIEGQSIWNRDVVLGLDAGGVRSAIEVYDWTTGLSAAGAVIHLADLDRNTQQAQLLARYVCDYRERYPQRPVTLIGHSGGGGIIVLALEALDECRVDMAMLLAPAMTRTYDLSTALQRVRGQVYNFYSERDVGLLKVGTSLLGSIDRGFGAAAGAKGFVIPEEASADERRLYADKLRQIGWSSRLKRYGADGGHFGWTSQRFARTYLAPMIRELEAHYSSERRDVVSAACEARRAEVVRTRPDASHAALFRRPRPLIFSQRQ